MNYFHDPHSWSQLYREGRLREAKTRRLGRRLRENRKARSGRGSVSLALATVLSPVHGT